jgi:DNA-binding CsgD family transcriptional regulator/tetratricopeptide (TPR) repeat protein
MRAERQARRRTLPRVELLERTELLDELRGAIMAARRGEGRVIILEGEAGVGKSSVLRVVARRPEAGTRSLWGVCDALTTPRPLGPLADMAAHGALATAARMAERAPIHEIFDAFMDDLGTPTVVVMEDIHWADEATLDLLRFVGRRIGDTPSLLLGSLRPEEVDGGLRAVLGDLATSGLQRYRIEPLSADAVRRLGAGHPVDPAELYRATGGNPFYVTEILAAPGASVPPTVRDAVLARASRLSAPAQELLEVASIEPGGVGRPLLRTLGVHDRAVDEAVGAAVLVDDGHVLRFRHELARRAIASSLTGDRTRSLHRRVLEALSDDPAVDPARLAHHAAGSGHQEAILRWSRAAGNAALRASAHREAVKHYAAAVEHVDALPVADGAALLGSYAEALTAIDQQARAVEAWEGVVELLAGGEDEVAHQWARAQLARSLWTAGRSREAYALMDEIVAALESVPGAENDRRVAEAYALASYMAMLARRSADAVTWARRAITVAESTGARKALPLAYNSLGCARVIGSDDLGGIEDLERSASIAQELGDRRSVIGAYSNTGSSLGEMRRYEPAAEALQRAVDYGVAHDFDYAGRYALAWLGRVRFEQGRWDEAAEVASSTLGDEASSPISPMVALVVQGRIRARRGEPDARAPLDEGWAIASRTNDLQRTWPAIAGLAEAAWLERWSPDDVARIAEPLERTLGEARSLRLRWAIGELAFWAHRLGDRPADANGAAPPYAASLAGDHWRAAELWRDIGCPYEAAWALADVDDEPALREALDRLLGLGARPLAARVRRRLHELGARKVPAGPHAATTTSPAGLTRRETEVLEFLRAGLTDREIADRLVLSPRTVSHHVSSILGKLGVRRRTEAIGAARELGRPGGPEDPVPPEKEKDG